jgi:hypothetical protein
MKNLTIVIRAELEVPDNWELVEHPSGIKALKIGDQYIDFDIAPLATLSEEADAEWSDHDTDLVDKILDTVVGLESDLEIGTSQ